jgi:hypothetical protein
LPAEEAAPTELRTSRPLAASRQPFAKNGTQQRV